MKKPGKLTLANLPTTLQRLPRLSAQLGVNLLLKRDDLTGAALSGNKVRKLEYSFAEAERQGANVILTTGGVQSNHCRATAIVARQRGLEVGLLLRTADGKAPGSLDGNYLLNALIGADLRHITPAQYGDRNALLEAWAREHSEAGRRPYVIPEGASNALGSLGYVDMALELAAQLGEAPWAGEHIDLIAHACGSGGTAAGLAVGRAQAQLDCAHHVYVVCDDAPTFQARIDGIIAEMVERFAEDGEPLHAPFEVIDEYKGIGYALSTPEELSFIAEIARLEGIFLDPVYTGKALFGLVKDVQAGRIEQGSTVLFVHTGGIFGLFPARDLLAAATIRP